MWGGSSEIGKMTQADAIQRLAKCQLEIGCGFSDVVKGTGTHLVHILTSKSAECAGAKEGDVVLRVGCVPTPNKAAFKREIAELHPGDMVRWSVQRRAHTITLLVRIGAKDVPLNDVRRLRLRADGVNPDTLAQAKEALKGMQVELGCHFQDSQQGTYTEILHAHEGKPGQLAGLMHQDCVMQIAGMPTRNRAEFKRALADWKPGDIIPFYITRPSDGGEKKLTVHVMLGAVGHDLQEVVRLRDLLSTENAPSTPRRAPPKATPVVSSQCARLTEEEVTARRARWVGVSKSSSGALPDGAVLYRAVDYGTTEDARAAQKERDLMMYDIGFDWLPGQEGENSRGVVANLVAGGAGDLGGLKNGDEVLRVNGQEAPDALALRWLCIQHRPGDTLELMVRRQGGEANGHATVRCLVTIGAVGRTPAEVADVVARTRDGGKNTSNQQSKAATSNGVASNGAAKPEANGKANGTEQPNSPQNATKTIKPPSPETAAQPETASDGVGGAKVKRKRRPKDGSGRGRTRKSKPPNLLLVEDVVVSQKMAKTQLSRCAEKYAVAVASDGESAVEQYKQHHASLQIVLMDVGLPGISGVEAAQQIQAWERERGLPPTVILALTANVDEDSLVAYQQAGLHGCITKGQLLANAVKTARGRLQLDPAEFVSVV